MGEIFRGLEPDEYFAWRAASSTALGRLARSPAHARAFLDGRDEDRPYFAFGRLLHCAVLEPERFPRAFLRGIEGDGRRKDVKEARAKLQEFADAAGAEIVKAADWEKAQEMSAAVWSSPRARALLEADGENELSVRWTDGATGVPCKARFDGHRPGLAGGTLVDVKTTVDASPRAFQSAIYRYGYHRQAAFYLRGAEAVGLAARHFVIIAVEKEPPFAVQPYRILDEALELADAHIDALLRRWRDCTERGAWPAYSDEVLDIGLPGWAWNLAAEDAEQGRA